MNKGNNSGTLALQAGQRFTYADYHQWPENEHWELINGQAWNMSSVPRLAHQALLGILYQKLANYLEGKPCQPARRCGGSHLAGAGSFGG
jgi:hypothetical protein